MIRFAPRTVLLGVDEHPAHARSLQVLGQRLQLIERCMLLAWQESWPFRGSSSTGAMQACALPCPWALQACAPLCEG